MRLLRELPRLEAEIGATVADLTLRDALAQTTGDAARLARTPEDQAEQALQEAATEPLRAVTRRVENAARYRAQAAEAPAVEAPPEVATW